MPANSKSAIDERRQKLFALLTRGIKGYEIAKELRVDSAAVSRDIKYLTAQSHNYLNSLAKSTLPFMYQASIEGIRDVIKEDRYYVLHDPEKLTDKYVTAWSNFGIEVSHTST